MMLGARGSALSFLLRPAGAGGGASVPCHPKILAQKDGKYAQFTDKKSRAQNS